MLAAPNESGDNRFVPVVWRVSLFDWARKVVDSDWESNIDRKIRSRFSVRLMNDTKWRELWSLIVQHSLKVTMSYADSQEWNSESLWGPFPADCVQQHGIGDPGIGGPFLYKQILSIRIPKLNQDTSPFMADAMQLEELPLIDTAEQIEVVAYR